MRGTPEDRSLYGSPPARCQAVLDDGDRACVWETETYSFLGGWSPKFKAPGPPLANIPAPAGREWEQGSTWETLRIYTDPDSVYT